MNASIILSNSRPEPKCLSSEYYGQSNKIQRRNARILKSGDQIFVRLVSARYASHVLAEITLNDVNDMSEIYRRLRNHTVGKSGLAQLYLRNITRGWSMQQPFMIYERPIRIPTSVTRPIQQPEPKKSICKRQIPESIRLRYSM